MTMRYQYRVRGGMEEPINSKSKGSTTLGLPPEIPSLPSLLKESGYATALIGKWHLGYPPAFGPLRSGYEDFYGIMAGGVDYFSHCSGKETMIYSSVNKSTTKSVTSQISCHAALWITSKVRRATQKAANPFS